MDNYSADKHKWKGRLDIFTVDVSCVMDRYTSMDDNSRDFLSLFVFYEPRLLNFLDFVKVWITSS